MNVKSVIIAFVISLIGSVSLNAQTAQEIQTSISKMESKSALCNKGPEAFKTFIAQFSSDEEFMKSRIKLDETQQTKFAELLVPSNFTAKKPFAKDGDMYYQAWGELQYNKTYLDCGWVDSYITHTFLFERIDGKWHLKKVIADE
jgi:hypothetical protein